jgi:hypothetical protein
MEGVDKILWSERIYQSPSKGNERMINIINDQINQLK